MSAKLENVLLESRKLEHVSRVSDDDLSDEALARRILAFHCKKHALKVLVDMLRGRRGLLETADFHASLTIDSNFPDDSAWEVVEWFNEEGWIESSS